MTWVCSGTSRPTAAIAATGTDDGSFETQQVELRLDQQQVDAAFEQTSALDLVRVAEVGEADLAEGRELRARPDRTRDEAVVAARDLTRDPGRIEVDLVGLVGDAVLGERDRERTERRRLHHVHPDLEERFVHLCDEVGPRQHEHLVASFELGATEVVTREALLLHVRPEGAVVDHDALVDRLEISATGHSDDCTGHPQPGRSPFVHSVGS